jgi:glycosyltransferase involved in cell wall biosynthesis
MSDAVRVAFIDQVGGSAGGAEETLATFIESAKADVIPHAILFEDGAFAERLRGLGTVVDVLRVPDEIIGSTRERMRVTGAIQAPGVALATAALLRRRRIDVAYTNSMKAHFIGAFAARAANIPCVMHFHDIISGAGLNALRAAARLGSRERIACSELVARTIGVGETTVIYGPVKLSAYALLPERGAARARLGLPQHVPIVALVGRINRWKGHDRFLRIAARVAAGTDAHFAIAGAAIFRDADFVPELHALAATLGITDRVTFIPWLDDVREIYAACDVNTNCSTREPFGRAIVEAAACGVPTVCFGDSGAAETIVDTVTGFTVSPGDEDGFAAAILKLLIAPDLRSRVSAAARAATNRFDASLIAQQMSAVIRRSAA